MDIADRLILWHPADPEFPTDAWEVLDVVFWTILRRQPEWSREEHLRALLATPELRGVWPVLDGIALRHGLQANEDGRLMALHSVLIAGEDLRTNSVGITERLKQCEASGDACGKTEALRARAHLEPRWFDYWQDLVTHVEETDSAAAALAELRAGKPFLRDNSQFRFELLRLICACGTREEALAEAKEIREQFGEFAEFMIEAHEEFLPAWRSDSDAAKWRGGFQKSE